MCCHNGTSIVVNKSARGDGVGSEILKNGDKIVSEEPYKLTLRATKDERIPKK